MRVSGAEFFLQDLGIGDESVEFSGDQCLFCFIFTAEQLPLPFCRNIHGLLYRTLLLQEVGIHSAAKTSR